MKDHAEGKEEWMKRVSIARASTILSRRFEGRKSLAKLTQRVGSLSTFRAIQTNLNEFNTFRQNSSTSLMSVKGRGDTHADDPGGIFSRHCCECSIDCSCN